MFLNLTLAQLALQNGGAFMFVDGKTDNQLADLTRAECARRGVKFLPKQVMKPIYAHAGLQSTGVER
ncbi:hypothetical protein DAPPUDRAFT_279955 [Daphnia pulex]|uniref:Uncharacterized protein n=1 Tax=Daphnia pulex TaxID=6669 RepID=E9I7N4_DAPPU|nr:hypothetical protein DAPPUDRAFT_279955 [Daphnia pulex]|eukprot:EFX59997.1 hypothetical protein DAPPUDRAFT_279955 [Daphnia pulex]